MTTMHTISPSKHARRHAKSLNATNLWVFGYASLCGRSGVNGRGMRHHYRDKDFTEAVLTGYRRELNATFRWWDEEGQIGEGLRYFGITKQDGHVTNGVVFPIAARDIAAFIRSEGGDRLYTFVDITSDLVFAGPSPLKPGDRVYTCVVRNPDKTGFVSNLYRLKVEKALSARSAAFRAQFGAFDSYL